MKERIPCIIDEQGCLTEFSDELADCGELSRLEELGAATSDLCDMSARLATLLPEDGALLADLLAGYTDCMDEAIRYLVEEESYSLEHPVVQGLRQHLLAQQGRVLLEAARAHTTTTTTNNNNNNNNNTPVALLVETFCNIRPPSG